MSINSLISRLIIIRKVAVHFRDITQNITPAEIDGIQFKHYQDFESNLAIFQELEKKRLITAKEIGAILKDKGNSISIAFYKNTPINVLASFFSRKTCQSLSIHPDTAMIGYAVTAQTHRGKGINSAAITNMMLHLKSLNTPQVALEIDSNNIASIKSTEKAGVQKLKTVKYIRVLGILVYRKSVR